MSRADFLNPWTAIGESRGILYQPFIREGDAVCLVGQKGSGKSTAACEFLFKSFAPPCHAYWLHDEDNPTSVRPRLDITRPIDGRGELFGGLLKLNGIALEGRRGVILDGENDHVEWKSLLEETAAAYGISPNDATLEFFKDRILWMDATATNWNDFEAARKFIDHEFIPDLIGVDCGMLIVDSTHKLWTRNLNDPEWVSEGLGHLRKRCRQHGITLICLTHTSRDYEGKSEAARFLPRGTSQQENEFDVILGLERKVRQAERSLRLHLVKRRAGKWNDEGTYGSCALSPTHGGYGRMLRNPWTKSDPRRATPEILSVSEEIMLRKFTPDEEVLKSKIPGNRSRNAEILDSLVDAGFLEVRLEGRSSYYKLSVAGEKTLEELKGE